MSSIPSAWYVMPMKLVILSGVLLQLGQARRAGSFISGGVMMSDGALFCAATKGIETPITKIARLRVRVLIAFVVCFRIYLHIV